MEVDFCIDLTSQECLYAMRNAASLYICLFHVIMHKKETPAFAMNSPDESCDEAMS